MKKRNLYLLSRVLDAPLYDVLNNVVVSADSEQVARGIASIFAGDEGADVWVNKADTKIKLIGTGTNNTGVICRDFNAG